MSTTSKTGVLYVSQIPVDTLIRTLRESKGITQKALCEGLCSKDELSRIERGLRRPHWWLFEQLMQRLGEDPQMYYAAYNSIITQEDKRVLDLRTKLSHLLRNPKQGDEAKALIAHLEQDDAFKDGIHLQFLLKSKATLAYHNNDYKSLEKYAMDAIKLTKPTFCEDDIGNYILSSDEIRLIQHIAAARSLTSYEESANILFKLKDALYKIGGEAKNKLYPSLVYNLSKCLGLIKRYNECIVLCDQGIDFCAEYRDSYYIPLLLVNKAFCLFHMQRNDDAIKVTKEAFLIFGALKRHAEISAVKTAFKAEFGIYDVFD